MTRLAHSISQNLANRAQQPAPAEQFFAYSNLAATAASMITYTLLRTGSLALSGLGFVARKAVAAWPGVRASLTAQTAAIVRAAARRRAETVKSRAEQSDDDLPAVMLPSAAARRRWNATLKEMGRAEVLHWLERTAYLPSSAAFTYADSGIIHGSTRYPSRAFALEWADGTPDDGGHWRVLAWCATGTMAAAGLLLWSMG